MVEGGEGLRLRLRFLQRVLGMLTLTIRPTILPSRHHLDTLLLDTDNNVLIFGLDLNGGEV
jgi:hypothetical protein